MTMHLDLDNAIIEDRENGIYRANRSIFTDEEIFELEMRHIFEGNWIYLAHESQVPNPGDYFTGYIGRQPIVITRSKDGTLNGLINACAHRGAMLCRKKTDNRMTITCPFHGWTFRNDGKLLKVKDPDDAGYPDSFNVDGSHDLTPIARFDSYRGFLFGSLNPDVLPLTEHLGDATKIIDMLVDQSPDGLEVLRGASTYTYDGNWKVQAENGADGYHVTATHWNYAATTSRRSSGESKNTTQTVDAGKWGKAGGGYWSFPNGHLCLWTWASNWESRPLVPWLDQLKEKYGDAKGEFMVKGSRNLCVYPNVYIMDQFSTQIRHFRPLAPNKTEVTIYCIAPKGESPESRAHRIRQYEDFFNASGMATPDDLEEFRSCQFTFQATASPWNDMSRGAEHWHTGPDSIAESLDLDGVISSGAKNEDEGLYPVQHGYWLEVMRAAVEGEDATLAGAKQAADRVGEDHELARKAKGGAVQSTARKTTRASRQTPAKKAAPAKKTAPAKKAASSRTTSSAQARSSASTSTAGKASGSKASTSKASGAQKSGTRPAAGRTTRKSTTER